LIAISTDKAVNSTSVMGATKRVMELVLKEHARKQDTTSFSAVRFGNVFNSDGSVVRLFQKQIESGGPITITHPDAERFFMSVTEAAQLVIQAGAFTDSGSIYILNMGRPIRIYDVASEISRLRGHRIGETIDVIYTGLTKGEKMTEILVTEEENVEKTPHERVMRLVDVSSDWDDLEETMVLLKALVDKCDRVQLIEELQRLVPEFRRAL